MTLRRPFLLPLVILLVAACTSVPLASGTPRGSAPTSTPPAPSRSPSPSAQTATPPPASTPSPAPTAAGSPPPVAGVEVARADVPRAAATAGDARAAAAAVNALTIDLHRELASGGTNTVLSGASVAIALGMARAGARGETAAEMDDVLYGLAADDHANWINSLDQALASRSGTFQTGDGADHELLLAIANAWFAQADVEFEGDFLEVLAARFDAGMHLVDFIADTEAARQLINAWGNERTRGRIPEVLKPRDLTSSTRFALVNAIYLKAPWRQPFEVGATAPGAFHLADGSSTDVPLMHATMPASCSAGDGWSAAELPYIGDQLAMLVIVPEDLEAFETGLDTDQLEAIAQGLKRDGHAEVSLPTFEIESRAELSPILAELGMPATFDPGVADFSGITREIAIHIGKVIHQANITVDEAGTEAAAVTVVTGDTSGGTPPVTCSLTADRPFFFAVRDIATGAILFMGRVVDPS